MTSRTRRARTRRRWSPSPKGAPAPYPASRPRRGTPAREALHDRRAAQLMQLRETEAVRVLDDHHRRPRNVDADLDDGRRHEDLHLARAKRRHDLVFLRGSHASMQKLHAMVDENLRLKERSLLDCGRHVISLEVSLVLDGDHRVKALLVSALLLPARVRLGIALGRILPDQACTPHTLARRGKARLSPHRRRAPDLPSRRTCALLRAASCGRRRM